MSQFTATKCDECGHIQGEANHWQKIDVFFTQSGDVCGLLLGPMVGNAIGVSSYSSSKFETHDLCGQGCAMKHIAKLLGWSQVNEASA